MDIAFVLGNGTSRQGLPLDELNTFGHVYGCNALFRDYIPDVLVATDKPIATHIEQTGYAVAHTFYTRKPTPGSGALIIPDAYFAFSSGPAATGIAAANGYPRIYLIGFDLGPTTDQKFNNLYAGTEFYKAPGTVPTYTGNWVRQIQQICKEFAQTKFIRVCGETTARLPELEGIHNLMHLPFQQFVEQINTKRNF